MGAESLPELRDPPGMEWIVGEPPDEADLNNEVQIVAPVREDLLSVVSADALAFVAELARRFGRRRLDLLNRRRRFREAIRADTSPTFLSETQGIRETGWQVASPPSDLHDRRVEITGPVDRKTIINALNSGANVFMADFEDAHSPTWEGTLEGQRNLRDAVRRTIQWSSREGRRYALGNRLATLMVRPRGWHLVERHVLVDREPIPASLFDAGLYLFHNARALQARGTGPYFYLPKLEHHQEAILWDEVFSLSEMRLGLPRGAIRATVLIETLPAAFEMEEILYALRNHSAGLNCGRWDYLFSFIKQYRDDPSVVFPDRSALAMTAPFLEAYARLLVETCHRRGASAIGGMAAQIPIRRDPQANREALAKVVADKKREVALGYDGTWVAHPDLVNPVREVFERRPPVHEAVGPSTAPEEVARRLLEVLQGPITLGGVRTNVRASLRYLESWFRGIGCVPIDHLMEDAATVEIARAQLWHWIHRELSTTEGTPVTAELVRSMISRELHELQSERGSAPETEPSILQATTLLDELATGPGFPDFFTERAYPMLDAPAGGSRA